MREDVEKTKKSPSHKSRNTARVAFMSSPSYDIMTHTK